MSIKSESVSVEINGIDILKNINVEVSQGEILTIVGPNGAGKSTFLNVLSGDIEPSEGLVFYDETLLGNIDIEKRSFTRSVMSQSQAMVFDFSVREIIEMGWIDRGISSYAKNFKNAMTEVVEECNVGNLLNQTFNTLSGGEQRRVHFARTLLQLWRPSASDDPRYLLLDEPTANLDLSHEVKLLDIIKNKSRDGFGILLVIHDLNLAAKFSDKIALFKNGSLVKMGSPDEVLTSEILTDVYKIPIDVSENPLSVKYY
tara:strand:+ start:1092 stop:1865 length:774 start_codon:yes stop_codon:yes gene_type:complete